ncbi:MAG: ribonuclease HI family protein [Patescibacteria group bacterium]
MSEEKHNTVDLYTDGGSRGNPGPAGIGYVIKNKNGKIIEKNGKFIGKATNNEAEYQALIAGLKAAKKYTPKKLNCFSDSALVVNQLNGEFKVKKAHLKKLVFEVQSKLAEMLGTTVKFQHIPREENSEADALLNEALDNKEKENSNH